MKLNKLAASRLPLDLERLPPLSYAVAYGSAVLKQVNYEGSGMVDYIVAVDDPVQWHSDNLQLNGYTHYSPLGIVGGRGIGWLQSLGAGVYFNVPNLEGKGQAKYAVVQTEVLKEELRDWRNLYLSGRLQKPVLTLVENDGMEESRQQNLSSALDTALLLLPNTFTQGELFSTICEISYTGDPRMGAGEHPDKPKHIALAQIPKFRELYNQALKESEAYLSLPTVDVDDPQSKMEQDVSATRRADLFLSLPQGVIDAAGKVLHNGNETRNLEDVLAQNPAKMPDLLKASLASIIAPTAKIQMVKGLFSFGMGTAFEYVLHKLRRAQAGRAGQ